MKVSITTMTIVLLDYASGAMVWISKATTKSVLATCTFSSCGSRACFLSSVTIQDTHLFRNPVTPRNLGYDSITQPLTKRIPSRDGGDVLLHIIHQSHQGSTTCPCQHTQKNYRIISFACPLCPKRSDDPQ